MRVFLRVLGTWLLGVALILLIIDGTKSLGASQLVFTSLAEDWSWAHAPSLATVREFIAGRFFGLVLEPTTEFILASPGWAVLAIPGALFAWANDQLSDEQFVALAEHGLVAVLAAAAAGPHRDRFVRRLVEVGRAVNDAAAPPPPPARSVRAGR